MTKQKMCARLALLALSFVVVMLLFTAIKLPMIDTVYAANGLEDDLYSQQETQTPTESSDNVLGGLQDSTIAPDDKSVSDWLKQQRTLQPDQLKKASETMSPLVKLLGYAAGGIIILTVAGVTVITALDLLYIAVPPVRGFLYKGGADAGMAGGMPGMGMGMRGRMGMMGGSMGGAQQGVGARQWVSDEAVACAALLGGGAQAQGGAMAGGMMGGMMGGYGGMAQMGANQQQAQSTKSVIGMYFKKRIFFMILLALCIIVLTSSAIMNCGVNLAEWFLKIVNMLNGKMSAGV